MNRIRNCLAKWGALLLGLLLAASLSACAIPMPGFADYDVSGYIQALLDSSYLNENEDFINVANSTSAEAAENNAATVENAAVDFCNTYGLSPTDQQLQQLQDVMRQAFAQARFTVKEERKVDTGYYLEVDVVSILNFSGCEEELEQLRLSARQEASRANEEASSAAESAAEEEEDDDRYVAWGEYDEYGQYIEYDQYGEPFSQEEEEVSSQPSPTLQPAGDPVDPNDLFFQKVLDFCESQLKNIVYEQEPRTIALDILQTPEGELQLDMNQLETIDKTVLRFTA